MRDKQGGRLVFRSTIPEYRLACKAEELNNPPGIDA